MANQRLVLDTTTEIFANLKILNKMDRGPIMTVEKLERSYDGTFFVQGHVTHFTDDRRQAQHPTIRYFAAYFGITQEDLDRGYHYTNLRAN